MARYHCNHNLYELYEQLSKYTFTMESGQCVFDQEKLEDYFNQIPDIDVLTMVKLVINQTYYATFDDVKDKLLQAFEQFKQTIGNKPFIVITEDFPKKRISSQSLMIYLLWDKLKLLNFQGIYNMCAETFPSCDVLVIDDAMYSGGQLKLTIDQWNRKKTHNTQCHVVVAYRNQNLLWSIAKEIHQYIGLIIKPVENSLGLENYLWAGGCINLPLYLDYKIASQQSTYYYIYHTAYIPKYYIPMAGHYDPNIIEEKQPKYGNLMKSQPSRKIIYDIEKVINELTDIYT